MEFIKQCKVCGKDFQAKSNKKNYCSNACRTFSFRQREKLKNTYNPSGMQINIHSLEKRISLLEEKQEKFLERFIEFSRIMSQKFALREELLEYTTLLKEEKTALGQLINKLEVLEKENRQTRKDLDKEHFDLVDLQRDFKEIKSDLALKENQGFGGASPLESIALISEKLLSNDLLMEKLAGTIPRVK